ncbi:hypothetical protein [Desertimonas flava]|uniref:hypothetical protein n=1 Tax=Desertimonas flava TaxID=2064846 RepID=UPI0013C53752|nr:hypothetical protein [Desertimonas flava]
MTTESSDTPSPDAEPTRLVENEHPTFLLPPCVSRRLDDTDHGAHGKATLNAARWMLYLGADTRAVDRWCDERFDQLEGDGSAAELRAAVTARRTGKRPRQTLAQRLANEVVADRPTLTVGQTVEYLEAAQASADLDRQTDRQILETVIRLAHTLNRPSIELPVSIRQLEMASGYRSRAIRLSLGRLQALGYLKQTRPARGAFAPSYLIRCPVHAPKITAWQDQDSPDRSPASAGPPPSTVSPVSRLSMQCGPYETLQGHPAFHRTALGKSGQAILTFLLAEPEARTAQQIQAGAKVSKPTFHRMAKQMLRTEDWPAVLVKEGQTYRPVPNLPDVLDQIAAIGEVTPLERHRRRDAQIERERESWTQRLGTEGEWAQESDGSDTFPDGPQSPPSTSPAPQSADRAAASHTATQAPLRPCDGPFTNGKIIGTNGAVLLDLDALRIDSTLEMEIDGCDVRYVDRSTGEVFRGCSSCDGLTEPESWCCGRCRSRLNLPDDRPGRGILGVVDPETGEVIEHRWASVEPWPHDREEDAEQLLVSGW